MARFEKAIEAMGDSTGSEVEVFKAALKRAQVASQEAPLAVQVRECESFIERARRRITKLDEERATEVAEAREGRVQVGTFGKRNFCSDGALLVRVLEGDFVEFSPFVPSKAGSWSAIGVGASRTICPRHFGSGFLRGGRRSRKEARFRSAVSQPLRSPR